ncbi:hypothetical protein KY308_00675 [Candidatus Woesearchaeota archaeon]|nr:hypothetical protein [Candidatus Woesearchaeota archaeon]
MTDLAKKVKKLLIDTALIVSFLALPCYSIAGNFYDRFKAESHRTMRHVYSIEELYFFDDNHDGTIDRIKNYAGTASRGIFIVPFEYTPKDKKFNDLLALRKAA